MAACSGSASGPAPVDAGAVPFADAAPPDAFTPGDMLTLVETTWTLPSGVERYICVRKTVTQEIFIDHFEPLAPRGTHHTVLTLDNGMQSDGVFQCGAAVSAPQMIYGSGVGTMPSDLPDGVAMRVRAGQQLLLNLHLYNTSEAPLTGTSGVRVRTIAPERVVHEAEAILAGTLSLDIPTGFSDGHIGTCTMAGDVTVFGVGPHMHKLGVHQKVTVERTGETLFDADYSFDDQNVKPINTLLLRGDRVKVECSYDNDTGGPVGWGESTDTEMCFAILLRWPALGGNHICLR